MKVKKKVKVKSFHIFKINLQRFFLWLQVHTLCPLDDISLSKLRICYLDPFKPLEERRRFLKQNYFFHCDCPRCEREDMGEKDSRGVYYPFYLYNVAL